ncbi:MAG: hypothetical protein ACQESN_11935 [Thermotogota bacterium]
MNRNTKNINYQIKKINAMKRDIISITLTIIALMFVIVACEKITDNPSNESNEADLSIMANSEGEFPIVFGSYSSGSPEITIEMAAIDSLYKRYYFEKNESIVSMNEAEIVENSNEETADAYLVISGINDNTEESRVLGLPLMKDEENEDYLIKRMVPTGHYECIAENCNHCEGSYSGGCNCVGEPIDEDAPSGCNHNTSGGIGWDDIIDIIGDLLPW